MAAQNLADSVRRARDEFLPAFKSAWSYTLLGLGFGGLLIAAERKFFHGEESLSSLILEHLGVGFIVAAIAVFFYEWGAHQKKVVEHSLRLTEIQGYLMELISSRGQKAFQLGLGSLVSSSSETLAELRRDLEEIVAGIAKLDERGGWAKDGYLKCLGELLSAVRFNVESLSNLDHPGEHLYIAGGCHTSDAILAVQMRELKAGDSYKVISHLDSWTHHRLDRLHTESRKALDRDVEVHRLFNLVRDCSALKRSDVEHILRQHARDAATRTGYEVRVLRRSDLIGHGRATLQPQLEGAQIAFFRSQTKTLRVDIRKVDLSELSFSTTPRIVESSAELFDEAWGIGVPLTEELIDDCLADIYSRAEA